MLQPTTCTIGALNFEFMEVAEHKAVVSDIIKKCHDATKLEEIKKMLVSFQEFEIHTVTIQEETLNVYVKDRITAVAERIGYTVATNKSAVLTSPTNHYSRFATSRPDLYMYSSKHHCSFVLNNQDYLEGVVTENKIPTSNPQAQLLGTMEKLAGDLLHEHLRNCSTDVRYIKIYGMVLNYEQNRSKAYRLSMDFQKKSCTLEEEMESFEIEWGLNRLLAQMEISTGTVTNS